MARCLLALGSNLGDRYLILDRACAEIDGLPQTQVIGRSTWLETAPIGGSDGQGAFLNGAVLLETDLPARELASALQVVEARLGRERIVRWDARTIDIDVLLYGAHQLTYEELVVPHPRMCFRSFVLEPAAEVAGSMLHPTTGWTIASLLAHLRQARRFVVVTGSDESASERLAAHLATTFGGTLWTGAAETLAAAYGSPTVPGVEFPASDSGCPPVVAATSTAAIGALSKAVLSRTDIERPALVVALQFSEQAGLFPTGLGPVAQITTANQETIMQEAEAAIRCVWPELQKIN